MIKKMTLVSQVKEEEVHMSPIISVNKPNMDQKSEAKLKNINEVVIRISVS